MRVADEATQTTLAGSLPVLCSGPIDVGRMGPGGKGVGRVPGRRRRRGYGFASRSRAAALSEVMAPLSVGSGTGAKSGEWLEARTAPVRWAVAISAGAVAPTSQRQIGTRWVVRP